MKLMIASDLHGSAYYTRKLLEAMDREQPERLVLLHVLELLLEHLRFRSLLL